jgi:hypothetical protein
LKRLFSYDINEVEFSDDSFEISIDSGPNKSLKEQFNNFIAEAEKEPRIKQTNFENLKKEFELFRCNEKRTENLDKLNKSLLTIKPSSTDAERTFFIASKFCTKIRSRLSDKSLNALVFLKYYYIRKNLS